MSVVAVKKYKDRFSLYALLSIFYELDNKSNNNIHIVDAQSLEELEILTRSQQPTKYPERLVIGWGLQDNEINILIDEG